MPVQQSAGPPPHGQTILVVSDEPVHVKLCKSVLEEAGFRVLTTDGSSEALKLCAQHEAAIDLLLADLILPPPEFQLASSFNQFPHVNGFDLAVRATAIRQGLRVALVCKDRGKELADHGLSRTTLPVLRKPVDPYGLTRLVQDVLTQPPPALDIPGPIQAANDTEWFG